MPHALSPPETGQPALHAIRDKQLDEVMLQINALVYGQMRNELESAHEKKHRSKEIVKIAHEITKAVDSLSAAMPRLNLLPNEKVTFSALADKLKSDASQIEDEAKREDLQGVSARVQNIMSTCTSCHSLFRNHQNLLDRCRDPKNTC